MQPPPSRDCRRGTLSAPAGRRGEREGKERVGSAAANDLLVAACHCAPDEYVQHTGDSFVRTRCGASSRCVCIYKLLAARVENERRRVAGELVGIEPTLVDRASSVRNCIPFRSGNATLYMIIACSLRSDIIISFAAKKKNIRVSCVPSIYTCGYRTCVEFGREGDYKLKYDRLPLVVDYLFNHRVILTSFHAAYSYLILEE